VLVHGKEVVLHFLFVVYPMEGCVDSFLERAPAFLASVALDTEIPAVTVEFAAGAARTGKAGEAGGEGKD